LPITINNPAAQIKFAFVEFVMNRVIKIVLENLPELSNKILYSQKFYLVGLGELVYYMQTLKQNIAPCIKRDDDFYEKLAFTYKWYNENHKIFQS
ncbi:MAG: hypothetical protein IJ597_01365, partial [Synergistaceae bacterium]|nr:hypothetical protein [Synergistaceae bacterium]